MDVVKLIKNKKSTYNWYTIKSELNEYTLYIDVFQDSMKFDNVPALTWDLKQIPGDDRLFNGVRLPATAHQLQKIADLLDCMLLTPKVIDLIWLQADIKFDSIVNINGKIVAISNIHDVHNAIESKIEKLGGYDDTKLISCVGKYWCLINNLNYRGMTHGDETSCNYGWFAKTASGPGITPGTQCWQRPGFAHNKQHWDPSQTIRLMKKEAKLVYPSGKEEKVNLEQLASDKELAYLFHHQGQLTYLRQKGVDKLNPLPRYFIGLRSKKPLAIS